jgi:hypothetical protein
MKRLVPLFVLLLIVALASLGVAYGLWSDELEINGVVHTGIVDAHMTLGEVDQGGYWDNDNNDDMEFEGKDVGECEAYLVNGPILTTKYDTIDTPPDKVEIMVYNGYPSFACYVEVDVENAGTIPIYVEPPKATNIQGPSLSCPTCDDVTVRLLDCWDEPFQLHPGEDTATWFPNCRVYIHVEQPAKENAKYAFEGRFLAWQWNETP